MDDRHENRWSTDEMYLRLCQVLAERTTCLRRRFGAIVVNEGRIVGSGVNGAPNGLAHCSEVGCLRDALSIPSGTQIEICRGVHAEMNALLQAGYSGCRGSTLYSNDFPCEICAKLCLQAGLARVVVAGDYPDRGGLSLLMKAGMEVAILPPMDEIRAHI